jgi:putative transposase
MAAESVSQRGISIRIACEIFNISESCYRYKRKLSCENAVIADWLIRLTHAWRDWGFGLCFMYLRNVKGFGWNHKRVYRIYKELELNLRIKPKKRLVREKPEPLAEPEKINQCWSMDFMHDQLCDGRSFRLFNVLDDFSRDSSRNLFFLSDFLGYLFGFGDVTFFHLFHYCRRMLDGLCGGGNIRHLRG